MKDGEGGDSPAASETFRLQAAEEKKTLLSSCLCSQQQCCLWGHRAPRSPRPAGLGTKGRLQMAGWPFPSWVRSTGISTPSLMIKAVLSHRACQHCHGIAVETAGRKTHRLCQGRYIWGSLEVGVGERTGNMEPVERGQAAFNGSCDPGQFTSLLQAPIPPQSSSGFNWNILYKVASSPNTQGFQF